MRMIRSRVIASLVSAMAISVWTATTDARVGVWEVLRHAPTAHWGASAAALDGRIYVMGGQDPEPGLRRRVEVYDIDARQWSEVADMPIERASAGAAALGGLVYAIGGSSQFNSTPRVDAYDPATDRWIRRADLGIFPEFGRAGLATTRHGSAVYAIGGQIPDLLSAVERYDASTDAWTHLPDMPTPRTFLMAAAARGRIYAIGGRAKAGIVDVVEVYDPRTDTWAVETEMLTARQAAGAAAVGDDIYVVGGHGPDGATLATGEVYDTARSRWRALPDMPAPRVISATVAYDGHIYVIGGTQIPNVPTNTVFVYDTGVRGDLATPNGDALASSWGALKTGD